MSVAGWIKDRLGIASPSLALVRPWGTVELTAADAMGESELSERQQVLEHPHRACLPEKELPGGNE